VNKGSTVKMSGNEIVKEKKLIIGMDLGDRSTRYCVLEEAGDVILERSVPTTKKGMEQSWPCCFTPSPQITVSFHPHSFRSGLLMEGVGGALTAF
jgi:hypothetical protein